MDNVAGHHGAQVRGSTVHTLVQLLNHIVEDIVYSRRLVRLDNSEASDVQAQCDAEWDQLRELARSFDLPPDVVGVAPDWTELVAANERMRRYWTPNGSPNSSPNGSPNVSPRGVADNQGVERVAG